MVEIKRKTPSGTQYVVQKHNETKNSTILQKFQQPTDKKIARINDTNTQWIGQNLKRIKRERSCG